MNVRHFSVLPLTIFAVALAIGCAKDRKSDEARMQDEGNQRIVDNAASEKDLLQNYGIAVNPGVESKPTTTVAKTWVWKDYTDEQRKEIRRKLNRHIANLSRIFEIGAHRGMKVINGESLKKSYDNAKAFLASLDAAEGPPVAADGGLPEKT